MEKSPDAFRTISEVADFLDIPAHVLRFWESRFPQIRPVKRAGGRRYYRPADVALLSGIRQLLHDEGMTIRGVQKILREKGVRHVAGLADGLPVSDPAEDALFADADEADFAEDVAGDMDAAPPVADVIPFATPPGRDAPPLILQADAADDTASADPAPGDPVAEDLTEPAHAPDMDAASAPPHWPDDPGIDGPAPTIDPTMPPPWDHDPDDPLPEDARPEEIAAMGAEVPWPGDAAESADGAADGASDLAAPPVLPDVPFDPAIPDAPVHIPTRLRAMGPDDLGGRRALAVTLYTRLRALRSDLADRAGRTRG